MLKVPEAVRLTGGKGWRHGSVQARAKGLGNLDVLRFWLEPQRHPVTHN